MGDADVACGPGGSGLGVRTFVKLSESDGTLLRCKSLTSLIIKTPGAVRNSASLTQGFSFACKGRELIESPAAPRTPSVGISSSNHLTS